MFVLYLTPNQMYDLINQIVGLTGLSVDAVIAQFVTPYGDGAMQQLQAYLDFLHGIVHRF